MPAVSPLIQLRDAVYAQLLLKQIAANYFPFNNFGTRKTWIPRTSPEEMTESFPNGLVTVVGGVMGDRVNLDRENLVLAEFSVKVAFQKYIDVDPSGDTSGIDVLMDFVENLEAMCRNDIGYVDPFGRQAAWTRTEFAKDENDIPFSFVNIAEKSTFEAYFDAYYHIPIKESPVTSP